MEKEKGIIKGEKGQEAEEMKKERVKEKENEN